MRVRFFGTRGSIATPGPETVQYGGNTPCVEVRVGNGRLIFDSGTGIRKLGLSMMKETRSEGCIFFSHVHWDHIQGLPFFLPAYKEGNRFELMGAETCGRKIRKLLSDQMEKVYFPVDLSAMRAELRFKDLGDEAIERFGAVIRTVHVNHTTDTRGFRVEKDGLTIVYLTDNELERCKEDGATPYDRFVRFAAGADLLIHDAQYERATLPKYKNWGHSAYEDAVRLALDAGARRLALYHHDPLTSDSDIDRRLEWCRAELAARGSTLDCFAAREEQEVDLGAALPASSSTRPGAS